MKAVIYTGASAVLHSVVGQIEPGLNQIHDDAVADALLKAGQTSGEFRAADGEDLARNAKGVFDSWAADAPDVQVQVFAQLEQAINGPSALSSRPKFDTGPDATDTPAESEAAPAPRARKRAQE